MDSASATIASRAWREGVGLNAAPYRYAPSELKSVYDNCKAKPTPELKSDPVPQDASLWEIAGSTLIALKPVIDKMQEQSTAYLALQDFALNRLIRRKLVAFGYVLPRSPNDSPCSIPTDVWSGRIDWNKSTVSGNGLEFVAVRVLPAAQVDRLLIPHAGDSSREEQPIRGRPSLKIDITEAFERLRKNGLLDSSKSMSSQFRAIREVMAAVNPDKAGMYSEVGDETIRKHTSSLFKELKRTNKQ